MKAEFLTFQSTYNSLHTNIHEPRNINFRRRRKFDGTSVFSAIQTSVSLAKTKMLGPKKGTDIFLRIWENSTGKF